jgi:hypothetical protein
MSCAQVTFNTHTISGQPPCQSFEVKCHYKHPTIEPVIGDPAPNLKIARVAAARRCLALLGVCEPEAGLELPTPPNSSLGYEPGTAQQQYPGAITWW